MKLRVDVPASTARRERVESGLFARLSAIRATERADAAVADALGRRARWPRVALAGAFVVAAAAVAIALAAGHGGNGRNGGAGDGEHREVAGVPSRVVTPVGGSSRFAVGDAVIDVASDTSVEVQPGDDGALTLVLARGAIDCDVAPRDGRPPFRVVAGGVTVEVVGTRFAVARGPGDAVRVDVARGKVRVSSGGVVQVVVAGDSWHSDTTTTTADLPLPSPSPSPSPSPPPPPRLSPRAAFEAAQRLEARDRDGAARGYRQVADGADTWAAVALYSLAELDVARADRAGALHAIAEYERRFPRGVNAEDATWLRVEVLRGGGEPDAARDAAASYLARFPTGTYAPAARRLVGPP